MDVDFSGRCVLITGATRGIGLSTALAFARRGARCVLTFNWGGNEDEVLEAFAAAEAPSPLLIQADVSNDEDTVALLEAVHDEHPRVDVFVSNAAFGRASASLEDLDRRDLLRAVDYSAWPIVSYSRAIHQVFGHYPRYIVGMSSFGGDLYHPGYDTMGAAKAALEVLARYLAHHLYPEGVQVNILRTRFIPTVSLGAILGREVEPYLREHDRLQDPEGVAQAVIALCSGLMDGLSGQVLTLDEGLSFHDNLMHLYLERKGKEHAR